MGQTPRCLVCKTPMTPRNPRLEDRSRENNLCPTCYSLTTVCKCGCGREIPLYNGRGTKMRFYAHHYARTKKARNASSKRLTNILNYLWDDPEYRDARTGENHRRWKGGTITPQSPEFTNDLKKSVKERDDFTCQNPLCPHKDDSPDLHVHHIDGDRSNNAFGNLITLCIHCHMTIHAFHHEPLTLNELIEVTKIKIEREQYKTRLDKLNLIAPAFSAH